MSALTAAKLFYAVRLHFNNKKYNAVKFKFKTGVSFVSDTELRTFHLLDKKYKKEILQFYIPNLYENSCLWICDLLYDECHDVYIKHKRFQESLSYNFKNELQWLWSQDINTLIKIKKDLPVLMIYTLQKKISIDTLLMLESVLKFKDYWDKKLQDNIVWEDFSEKMIKYRAFMKIDVDKVKNIMKEVHTETYNA